VTPQTPSGRPRLTLTNDRVVAIAFKAADDGQGWIVRLYNVSDTEQSVGIEWTDPKPRSTFLSGTSESRGAAFAGPLTIPAWGLVTVRADR